jgi:hypothetical protein
MKKQTTKIEKYPLKYLPRNLSRKDRKYQKEQLKKSRKMYKKGKYYKRKPLKSYKSKTSKHILNARKIYGIEHIVPSNELAKKSGCSLKAMNEIVNKGMGAMYSSGSRPNQTAHSWAYARLASALTGGKSAAVDWHIIEKGCKKRGKAYTLAKKAKKKHGHGTRKVPKTK